jgi:hypothetical protein
MAAKNDHRRDSSLADVANHREEGTEADQARSASHASIEGVDKVLSRQGEYPVFPANRRHVHLWHEDY